MAVGQHWSPRSTEAMLVHMLAAVFSVSRMHHTSCSGDADSLTVANFGGVGHVLYVSHVGRQRPPIDHVKMYGSMSVAVSPEGL